MNRLPVQSFACMLLLGCAAGAPPEAESPEVRDALSTRDSPHRHGSGLRPTREVELDASVELTNDAGGPSPYACTQRSDCELKNVRNCCGYYPRCVNVNTVIPDGGCGLLNTVVCGFPSVDECDCRANKCVRLFRGTPIPDDDDEE